MQDRYAGDVGDFSKYAVLRRLVANSDWSCGLIWYRYPCELHNDDGKHINYFDNKLFAETDRELLDRLRVVAQGERSIAALEAGGLLPEGTRYFDEPIYFEKERGLGREQWFIRAMSSVAGSELVMVDPDNGLASPEHFRPGSRSAGKYVQMQEVQQLAGHTRCVVVYHHFGRNSSHVEQCRYWRRELSNHTGCQVLTLRYVRYSPRVYFLLTSDSAATRIAERSARELTSGSWSSQFELVE